MTDNHAALVQIANMPPVVLRELLYVNEPFTRREQVKRHYRTRGDLVASVYDLHLQGRIAHITHDPRLPSKHQA